MFAKEWIVDGCHLCVFCAYNYTSSSVIVVFDFSASFNDAAPVSLMLFAVDVKIKEKSELLMDVICVSFVFTTKLKPLKSFV